MNKDKMWPLLQQSINCELSVNFCVPKKYDGSKSGDKYVSKLKRK
jgi:hypothetical protein